MGRRGQGLIFFAPEAWKGSRRGYFFVGPILPAATGFRVLPELVFPVHLPIQLAIAPDWAPLFAGLPSRCSDGPAVLCLR